MKLKLIFPVNEHETRWHDIINEIKASNEEMVPYALSYRQHDFLVFMQKTLDYYEGKNLNGFVPASLYFLMDEKEEKIYGAVNIRHSLNEDLLFRGGHIGYGIRPSERRKGYATKMLSLTLDKCREMGLEKVLVTCDKDNIGSAKTIINNGGILENEITEDNSNVVQRYWIKLL